MHGHLGLAGVAAVALSVLSFAVASRPHADVSPASGPSPAESEQRVALEPIDPETARVDYSAAERFANLWRRTAGAPSAKELEEGYLRDGGRALEIFTPGRIVNAKVLARRVRRRPKVYADAIERCLPWIEGTNPQLRSTYRGLRDLFPTRELPHIAVVIGADNTGGTAAQGMQVIGLEVVCRLSGTREDFERIMGTFFAHEAIHTFQSQYSPTARRDPLLAAALREGAPDYIAKVVTGEVPSPERDRWASARSQWVWAQFQADRKIVRDGTDAGGNLNRAAKAAYGRWFENASRPPKGRPGELGYWVGMQIATRYVAASDDRAAALESLIAMEDPTMILEKSKLATAFDSSE